MSNKHIYPSDYTYYVKTPLDVTKLVLVTGVFMYVENGVARYLTGDEQKELVEIIRKKVIDQ
jgi:hypothetical protein